MSWHVHFRTPASGCASEPFIFGMDSVGSAGAERETLVATASAELREAMAAHRAAADRRAWILLKTQLRASRAGASGRVRDPLPPRVRVVGFELDAAQAGFDTSIGSDTREY